jgi:DNA sulfur modification protein DndD
MIIKKLTLNNFRVFKGFHELDLTPKFDEKNKQPVVLFGGLNGAGKTSILTAVRLGIFGARSFGATLPKQQYKAQLKELTHQSKDGSSADDAFVEIYFQYVKQGEIVEYRIRRSWLQSSGDEELTIYENGFALSELSNEQAQSFLLDLIPVGVADLFFFDGERIKQLAEEEDNLILADALKKMVGIDFIERGIADLSIILREKNKEALNDELLQLTDASEKKLEELRFEISSVGEEIQILRDQLGIEQGELNRLNDVLKQEGGEWSLSRDDLIAEEARLKLQRDQLITQTHDVFRGNLPFVIAPKFMKKLFVEIERSNKASQAATYNKTLASKRSLLAELVGNLIDPTLIDSLMEKLAESDQKGLIEFVTPTILSRVDSLKRNSIRDNNSLNNVLKQLEKTEAALDELGKNLARVPDKETLKERFEKVANQEIKIAELKKNISERQTYAKDIIAKAIKLTRTLEHLMVKKESTQKDEELVATTKIAIHALNSISQELLRVKVLEIQKHFAESFGRMARKDDMQMGILIDPETFSTKLVSKEGFKIDKNRLSAGEKQIYALAILESLGKASGRKLPFIIDTPLGRLDSKHRAKIVNEFFPKVNDQVIILSTDTEVDETFFSELEPNISHSYEIKYNSVSGSSIVSEGYFWRKSV